jgi:chaperonin cofactor prefoldin
MSFMIPDRPTKPDLDTSDPQYAAKMLDFQQQMSNYQLAVQTAQQELNQTTSTATNLEKSRHDAMMAIIRNLG